MEDPGVAEAKQWIAHMDEIKKIAHRVTMWQEAHKWVLEHIELDELDVACNCTEPEVSYAVDRARKIFVCCRHGRVHLCGTDPCEKLYPREDWMRCTFSGERAHKRISSSLVRKVTHEDAEDVEEGAQRKRRRCLVMGEGGRLEKAPQYLSELLTRVGEVIKKNRGEEKAEVWSAMAPYVHDMALSMWNFVEAHGERKVPTRPKLEAVTLYFLMNMAGRGLYRGQERVLAPDPNLKGLFPSEKSLMEGTSFTSQRKSNGMNAIRFALERAPAEARQEWIDGFSEK